MDYVASLVVVCSDEETAKAPVNSLHFSFTEEPDTRHQFFNYLPSTKIMEPEDVVMRVTYFVLFITLALMSWSISVQSMPLTMDGSPCSFNLLCSCTKPGPMDFGIVSCFNVPFSNFPAALNTSARAFILSMAHNDLRVLEAKQLVSSGLWRLEVRHNNLHHIEDQAFWGLTKFLAELDLSDNKLTSVPISALQSLPKLRVLNLNGNQLADLSFEDGEGFPNTLTHISLSNNFVTNLPEDALGSLPNLERLDLSENSISFVHPQAFIGITRSLKYLDLSGNLLRKIPFEAVDELKLENLDLSQNLISSTVDLSYFGKLSLGSVNLAVNRISFMPFDALQNFRHLKSLNLSYNPMVIIGDEAFKGPNLQTLDLSHCFIQEIYPGAFHGLQTTLRGLDLGFNNISYWPLGLFAGLTGLRKLVVENNGVGLSREELTGMQLSLQHLSLLEDKENLPGLDVLRGMSNLRELDISWVEGMTTLTPNLFHGFAPNLQRLKISYAKINAVLESPFDQLTGLKVLDLSENRIGQFHADAFQGMGHSVTSLILSNAIRSNTIQPTLLHPLTSLEYLDLSSNTLINLPEPMLAHSGKLTHLNLRFNKVASLPKGWLDPAKTPSLEQLSLGFNQLKEVEESTFAQLRSLQRLELNDNMITTIHNQAFQGLTSLEVITLAGNRLSSLEDEAFTNLPHLHLLDLSHNRLSSLNISAFEQVGTLSSLKVDASWNKITSLGQPPFSASLTSNLSSILSKGPLDQEYNQIFTTTTHLPSFPSSSSIEVMDFSHNNISFIESTFFAPISSTLLELDLSWNNLNNLTHHHLSGMRFLQRLRVDRNTIDTLEYDTFQDSRLIQVISLDNNVIRDLPPDLLEDCTQLRVFSVESNRIRSLAEPLFKDTQIEILNMAGNQFVRFPEAALSRISSSLVHLDLSFNELSTVTPSQIETLERLRWLSLKNNRIAVMGDTTFSSLKALLHLDISGNPMGRLSTRMFEENRHSLLYLNVANMSLTMLPDFDTFSRLLTFNVSHNALTFLPTNFGVNMSSLRTLDVSGNEIPSSPNTVWHTIPRLQSIFLGDNPIQFLTNDSFLQLDHLHHLDISELSLKSVQTGILWPMASLKFLKMGPHLPATPDTFIHGVDSLQQFHLVVETEVLAVSELGTAEFPPKLSKFTLSGPTLTAISDGVFQGVTSRSFHLTVEDTGLVDLAPGVVSKMGDATDITLEIRGSNPALRIIGNPNQQLRPQPFSTYLRQFLVQDRSSISCSCDSGWIEFWIRQWMARTCSVHPNQPSVYGSCDTFLHGIRTLRCENGSETGLMQAFVTELECGWDSRSSITNYPATIPIIISVTISVFLNLN